MNGLCKCPRTATENTASRELPRTKTHAHPPEWSVPSRQCQYPRSRIRAVAALAQSPRAHNPNPAGPRAGEGSILQDGEQTSRSAWRRRASIAHGRRSNRDGRQLVRNAGNRLEYDFSRAWLPRDENGLIARGSHIRHNARCRTPNARPHDNGTTQPIGHMNHVGSCHD